MLVPQDFEAAGVEQGIDVGEPEIDQVARYVDAVPAFAEEQKLPAGGVGNLNDHAAIRAEQLMGGVEIAGRVVQMFEDVKHGHGRATGGRQGSLGEGRADGRDARASPGYVRCVERKIEADHVLDAALGQHLEEQTAAAANVEHQARFLGFAQRALDEVKMIPEHEAPVYLFKSSRGIGIGGVPIIGRIVIVQLQWRRLRIEADQAAVTAFYDAENLVGGSIQAVCAGKQQARFAIPAGRTRVRSGDSGTGYVDCSESSLSGIRNRSSRRRICFGLKRCLERNCRRLRIIEGIIGNADRVPFNSAVAAVSLPLEPE